MADFHAGALLAVVDPVEPVATVANPGRSAAAADGGPGRGDGHKELGSSGGRRRTDRDDGRFGRVDFPEKGDLALGDPEQIGLSARRHHGHLDPFAQALAAHHGDAVGTRAVADGPTAATLARGATPP